MCVKETHKNKSGIKIYIYVYGGSVDCGSAAGGRVEQCVWGVVLREADSQAWSPASDHVSSFKYVDQRSAGPSMSLYVWGRERTPGPSWTSFRPWQRRAVGLRRRRGHWGCSRCCQVKPSPDSQLAHSSEQQLWRCPPAVVDHLDLMGIFTIILLFWGQIGQGLITCCCSVCL